AVAGCAPRLPGELQPQPRGGACAPDARHAGPEGVAGIPSFGRRNHPLAGLARPGPGSRAGWRAIGDTLPPLFFPKPDRSPVSTDRQGAAEAARDSRVFNRIVETLASELDVAPARIRAAIELFDEGATVPFIARYRKEATGGLDDTQLRQLDERLGYLRELEERRAAILASIAEQGKLDEALAAQIEAATTKQRLEDLYLPYKPKRRSRAQAAREAGLEPLADRLLADPGLDPRTEAAAFVRAPDADGQHGVADEKAALDGARDILAERFSERADVLAALRERLGAEGWIAAEVIQGKEVEGEKFRDYFEHAEPIATLPSHRALALFRGRAQGVLALRFGLAPELEAGSPHPCI